jgi:hypothetical protein
MFREFNLLLIYSSVQFWFVSVVPKYMAFVTFSDDFIACRRVAILSCITFATLEHTLGFLTLCSETAHLIATNTA